MLRYLESQFVKIGKNHQNTPVIGFILISLRRLVDMSIFSGIRLRLLILTKVRLAVKELCGSVDFSQYEREALKSYAVRNDFGLKQSGVYNLVLLYVLVRLKKPDSVIETGISSGRSSAAILEALNANNHGTLYSFDLDPADNVRSKETVTKANGENYRTYADYAPKDAEGPGWLVPDNLKNRWKVILGDSNKKLPEFVSSVDSVDIFYHDSDHTYETMMNEFTTVWPKLPSTGVLLADNSTASTAFGELSELHKESIDGLFYYGGLDALVKR